MAARHGVPLAIGKLELDLLPVAERRIVVAAIGNDKETKASRARIGGKVDEGRVLPFLVRIGFHHRPADRGAVRIGHIKAETVAVAGPVAEHLGRELHHARRRHFIPAVGTRGQLLQCQMRRGRAADDACVGIDGEPFRSVDAVSQCVALIDIGEMAGRVE